MSDPINARPPSFHDVQTEQRAAQSPDVAMTSTRTVALPSFEELAKAATAKVRALEADAARYRWLRERYRGGDFLYEFQPNDHGCAIVFRVNQMFRIGADLDQSIDAARGGDSEMPGMGDAIDDTRKAEGLTDG